MNIREHPLHRLPKFGDGIGLHRVRSLMKACGIDDAAISSRAVAVTGSNGKGSTARIASALLGAQGDRTGLFTSPHLYRYNERFRIDGEPVDDGALSGAMDEVHRAVEAYRARRSDRVGAFEAQFAVALLLFLSGDCRHIVLEAGIGGRYDPVRCARATVTGLVSLDLEHTELLGNSLLEIACDKLDATAQGGTAILGETCLPFVDEIAAYAELRDIAVEFVTPEHWTDRGVGNGRQYFDLECQGIALDDLESALVGRHQINNHAVATALVRERLKRSGGWPMAGLAESWRRAVAQVRWPGRLETISSDPLVIVDVGHTPEGIRAALGGFHALAGHRDALLVTGGSRNKHVREMLEILAPSFRHIVCTAAHHNGIAAADIEALVRFIRPDARTMSCPTIDDAVALARTEAARGKLPVYVAGGLFLAAEFAEGWRGGNPSALRFF